MQNHMNRVMAYDHHQMNAQAAANAKGGAGGQHMYKSNIKEMMNTSAPICISSYIKNGQRPNTKATNRR